MISPTVIQIQTKSGKINTYIKKPDNFYDKALRDLQHKCRVKEVIYGGCFVYYDDEMDFTCALNAGSTILIDNR